MIIDVSEFIKMSLMDKSVRPFLFEVVMNNLSLQHHLGFISTLKIGGEDDNTKGDKLYEFAKEQMGEKQYEYFIVDKESDILLKDVDLVETRKAYIQFATEVLDTVNSGIMKYSTDAYKVIPEISKTNSKKKKRHHKRH